MMTGTYNHPVLYPLHGHVMEKLEIPPEAFEASALINAMISTILEKVSADQRPFVAELLLTSGLLLLRSFRERDYMIGFLSGALAELWPDVSTETLH